MPLYYFNLFNDEVVIADEGIELPDEETAQQFAIREARALAAESVRQGHLTLSHRIDYADEAGPIGTVRFGEAVEVNP